MYHRTAFVDVACSVFAGYATYGLCHLCIHVMYGRVPNIDEGVLIKTCRAMPSPAAQDRIAIMAPDNESSDDEAYYTNAHMSISCVTKPVARVFVYIYIYIYTYIYI